MSKEYMDGPWHLIKTEGMGAGDFDLVYHDDPPEQEYAMSTVIAKDLWGPSAKLIAAAPDLLAACRAWMNAENDHKAARLTEAAIARATE